MKKKFITITAICVCALMILPACGQSDREKYGQAIDSGIDTDTNRPADENTVDDLEIDETQHEYTYIGEDDSTDNTVKYSFESEEGNTETLTVKCNKGTADCFELDETTNTLTFSGIAKNSEYTLSGSFHGNLVIDSQSDNEYDFTLDLEGLTLTSYDVCPINFTAGDEIEISAKRGYENYVFDLRDEVEEDSDDKTASIYAACDLSLKGNGELYVKSTNNKGIHSKDDLECRNLSLYVDCKDNCLKGNDSVTIESGTYTLIARQGDGIKTENSNVSSKGNQKGTIEIKGGDILVYAACDGIDSSYDVVIGEKPSEESADDENTEEEASIPAIEIYTDKYSKYSEEVTATDEDNYYIKCSSTNYKYSLKYFNSEKDNKWVNSSDCISKSSAGRTYYYYPVEKLSGYAKMQIYVYDSSQKQGQEKNYIATSILTPSTTYDTIYYSTSRGNTFSWENYSTAITQPGGGFGGNMGGMQSTGNADKSDYSTKGIKADDKIEIYDSNILVSSYDDAIHANSDVELENGESPEGAVTICGGNIELYTNDDGVHADETLTVEGGKLTIGGSYEGLEGKYVVVAGGDISIISSDDGVNGTCTAGTGITVSGGTLYVYASGDGLDSNSKDRNSGIVISGGKSVVISTSNANSSIDNENGYRYEGGYILGIGMSGGMSSEASNCQEISSNGTVNKKISLTKGDYLVVDEYVTVQMPVSISAYIVFLCERSDVSITSEKSVNVAVDTNGIYWGV